MTDTDSFLKTRQVARALGVSASSVKRWVDAGMLGACRTVGGHRLVRLSEALRFAVTQGFPCADLESLSGPGVTHVGAIDDRIRSRLLGALREGNAPEARALLRSAHAPGGNDVELADGLIRPVMEQIGHGWRNGTLDVFHEHQATQIIAASLQELIAQIPVPAAGSARLALGASPEDDPYVLPGLLGELIVREVGWDVRNLGARLPLASLANAVREYRPHLVFLSVSHLADVERFVREYAVFFETASNAGVTVVLGGRALSPEIRARMVFASFGDRMAHLAELTRRMGTKADSPPRPGKKLDDEVGSYRV